MTEETKDIKELEPCKCGGRIWVGVHDDEGDYKGEIGCEYESDPWSGICYGLHHDGRIGCVSNTEGKECVMGRVLFGSEQSAINAWNNRNSEWEEDETA